MRVRLLGPVSAETRGVPLRLGGRKQRAVFALLCLEVNNPVALDRLVHEVWNGEPPAQATLSLQSYISRLRRTIADVDTDTDTGRDSPRILTRPPGWALVLPADRVDAVRFAELAREGACLIESSHVVEGAARLREALALWSGDPLADIDDMPFAAEEKARLDELRFSVTESLLWADLDLGHPTEVVQRARGLVADNPYRERAWCALMLALYRLGRQAEALDVSQALRRTLSEGLGLDPSREARLLQEQILAQDPALERGAGQPSVAFAASAPPEQPAQEERVAAELVGREDATETLDAVTRAAGRGAGRFVVVEGPAGMGKSAVLHELSVRLTAAGGLVLRGGGVSAGASPALWPWVAIVRQLIAADPQVIEGVGNGGSAAALALLDPSVGVGPDNDGSPSEADPVLARTRLYRAVVDLLSAAHRTRPLALLVDDAHWLDPDTLALLALAADELVPRGVVVAVGLRPDESPHVVPQIDAIAARHRSDTVRLPLAGLSADDVAHLVVRTEPDAAVQEVAAALVARTGGNPLFVTELLRLLTSERRLDVASVHTVLPHQVRDVLRRRMDRLPDRTQALLAVVALLNRPATVHLLAEVTGVTMEAALDDTEAAVASSLLIEDPVSGGLGLSHDLVRQTIEESLSAIRRARIHARIAGVMQAAEESSPATLPETVVEIARHLVLAESVVGPNAAVPYLVTVADDARRRSAFHLAERALRVALELSARVSDPARRTALQLELRTRLALQSNVVSGAPGSAIFGEVDGSLDPAALDVKTDPTAWWGAQVLHVVEGRADRSVEDAAAALARPLPTATKSMVCSVMGLACFVIGELEASDRHLAQAERLGSVAQVESGEDAAPWVTSMLVSAPLIRAAVATLVDDPSAACEHVDRARVNAGASVPEQVLVEYFSAWIAAARGEPGEALLAAREAERLGRQLGDTFYLPMSRVMLGWATAMLGDGDGVAVARDAYAECQGMGLRFQATVHLLLCAEAHAHHGQIEEARDLARESRSLSERHQERTLNARLTRLAATLLAEPGAVS